MAIDARRVILAAVEAALDDVMADAPRQRRRARRGTGRAFLLGAGVVVAARAATSPRGRELLESAQQRLAEYVADGAGE